MTYANETTPQTVKANFDDAYAAPDPREYFRQLSELDYVIPDLAKDIFRTLVRQREQDLDRPVRVLDVGCSYGINAALVRYPLDIQRLSDRYRSPAMIGLEPRQVAALDAHYFQSWPRQSGAEFVGLDCSGAAISYARSVGLLDDGLSSNFEEAAPTEDEAQLLGETDIIISTGAVGYITERTFRRILNCRGGRPGPLIASFVLRMFPYAPIAAALGEFGLVTEKLEGVTFVQRRFQSIDEFEATNAHLNDRGIDTSGKEADGLLHAELYVSRPAHEVRQASLAELISVTSGSSRKYGRRYRETGHGGASSRRRRLPTRTRPHG